MADDQITYDPFEPLVKSGESIKQLIENQQRLMRDPDADAVAHLRMANAWLCEIAILLGRASVLQSLQAAYKSPEQPAPNGDRT